MTRRAVRGQYYESDRGSIINRAYITNNDVDLLGSRGVIMSMAICPAAATQKHLKTLNYMWSYVPEATSNPQLAQQPFPASEMTNTEEYPTSALNYFALPELWKNKDYYHLLMYLII